MPKLPKLINDAAYVKLLTVKDSTEEINECSIRSEVTEL